MSEDDHAEYFAKLAADAEEIRNRPETFERDWGYSDYGHGNIQFYNLKRPGVPRATGDEDEQ